MPEVWEHPPPILKTSMVCPWEALIEFREHPPPILETSMASPLGGVVGDSGAPTTYLEDVDGGAAER
jgi:hypothetical protein